MRYRGRMKAVARSGSDGIAGFPAEPEGPPRPPFVAGFIAAWSSVFVYVLFGTYVGFGALARDFGFSLTWSVLSTILIWAAPAQVILVSALAAGAAPLEAAIAVGLSGVRLLPMVVSVMPLMRQPGRSSAHLVVPAHMIAVSLWVEGQRLLPAIPREGRVSFVQGMGCGMLISSCGATAVGYVLAGRLPALLAACLLFLLPMSFLVSTARNSRILGDRLALAFGLALGPILAAYKVQLDLLWTGLAAGTLAYLADRAWRRRA